MKRIITLLAALAAASSLSQGVAAQSATAPQDDTASEPAGLVPLAASEVDLESLKWIKRPLVVFADTPADPRFVEQMNLLADRPAALAERDVVVIVDTDPDARSSVRTQLRPRGFQLTILGKDGTVVLRKPVPWNVREITRTIDKMPLRQDEIRRERTGS